MQQHQISQLSVAHRLAPSDFHVVLVKAKVVSVNLDS